MTPFAGPARPGTARFLVAGIVLLWLGGCATPQVQALLDGGGPAVPRRIEIQSVPYYAQEEYQCGPAALAMVLGAGGRNVTPEALRPQVYLSDRRGSLQVEMLAAARRNGFVALELQPRLADLLAEVAAGNPVIVLQNLALDWYPIWHYSVAIGYDIAGQSIVLRSGRDKRVEMPLRTFEHTWARSRYWAMLALPPRRLAASASADDYLHAVAKLEAAGQPQAARAAYEKSLQRWPDNLTALTGLGNTAHAAGDFKAAESAFRRATVAHPDSAAAYNNLAQTLADLARYDKALEAARTAVDLGGPHLSASTQTLEAITALNVRSKRKGRH